MLNEIINMYFTKSEDEKNEDKSFENHNKYKKIKVILTIIIIVLLITTGVFYNLYLHGIEIIIQGENKEYIYALIIFALGIIMIFVYDIFAFLDRKNTQENILIYKGKLEKFKNILLDNNFKMYSREKIEYLIDECDKYIIDSQEFNKKIDENNNKFITTWIYPILAAAAGIFLSLITDKLLAINICIMSVAFLFITSAFVEVAKSIANDISGNMPYKAKVIKDLLCDLLIIEFCSSLK